MKNIEARQNIYDTLDGYLACSKDLGGKGGQKLGIADKFLVNHEVDRFIYEYRNKTGNYPNLGFSRGIALFAPRVQQYGFEVSMGDFVQKTGMEVCGDAKKRIEKKRERENQNK